MHPDKPRSAAWGRSGRSEEVDEQLVHALGLVVVDPMRGVGQAFDTIEVGHVEAGLRTRNRWLPYPEEMNRRLTAAISSYHFAPTSLAREHLLQENVAPQDVVVTGNTVIIKPAEQSSVVGYKLMEILQNVGIPDGVVYGHEHLIIDSPLIADRFPHIHLYDVDAATAEVSACRAAGAVLMIDAMPICDGRDAVRLAEISRRTSVDIIAAT